MAKKAYILVHDNPDLIQKAKIKAMQEGKSLKDIIIDFLKKYVENKTS